MKDWAKRHVVSAKLVVVKGSIVKDIKFEFYEIRKKSRWE